MTEARSLTLLPPSLGLCQSCACDHLPEEPHNWQSLFWAFWFQQQHGRSPIFEEAFEHCSAETCDRWAAKLDSLPHAVSKNLAIRLAGLATLKRGRVDG